VVIPGGGHAINIDQPQAFIRRGAAFFGGLDARTTTESRIMKIFMRCIHDGSFDRRSARSRKRARGSRTPAAPILPRSPRPCPNNCALVFGMDAEDAARAIRERR